MKKWLMRALKIVGALILLVAVLVGGVAYSAFGGKSAIVDGAMPAPDVRVIKDGVVDVGMIDVGGGNVALIDAGNDPKATAIFAELTRRNLTADAVAAIFLTHGHPDHTAGCPQFPGATVFALDADIPLAEGREGGHGFVTRFVPVKPTGVHVTHRLADGATIEVGEKKVRVYAVPGHTRGSAAYLVSGVLFLGDSAAMTSKGTLVGAPAAFSDDSAQNHASVAALATALRPLKGLIVAIVPAHTGTGTLDALLAFQP